MKTLMVDMDGVVADFAKAIHKVNPKLELSDKLPNWEEREKEIDEIIGQNPYFYQDLELMPDAKHYLRMLNDYFDIYFLSTPMWDHPQSYTGKRIWVETYFGGMFRKKLILTHHKHQVMGDFLVDDRVNKGTLNFQGQFIHFGSKSYPNWRVVANYLMLNR